MLNSHTLLLALNDVEDADLESTRRSLKYHIRNNPVFFQCYFRKSPPCRSITKLCATYGIYVMQSSGTILRSPESPVFREIIIHFCRGFRARCQLEFHIKPINI